MSNFLGLTEHPSDDLLHWSDNIKDATIIREAWDKIPKKLWPHVKVLIEKSHQNAHLEEAEIQAGEGL